VMLGDELLRFDDVHAPSVTMGALDPDRGPG